MIPGSSGILLRKRRCASCGGWQAVSILLRDATVTCRRCGAPIPPIQAKPPIDRKKRAK